VFRRQDAALALAATLLERDELEGPLFPGCRGPVATLFEGLRNFPAPAAPGSGTHPGETGAGLDLLLLAAVWRLRPGGRVDPSRPSNFPDRVLSQIAV